MRLLIITIGAPGSGKSTWIDNNGLRPYCLEPDNLRMLFGSISTKVNGEKAITMKNDKQVWKLLFDLLEKRMSEGELTVIDATHSSNRMLNSYKSLVEKYRYRLIAIDFRNIPLDKVLEQNKKRMGMKIVPDIEIKRIYERSKTMKLPNWIKSYPFEITIDEIRKDYEYEFDYNEKMPQIKQINVFSDIHGCFKEFKTLYDKTRKEMGLQDDEIFDIFVGDYFDRFLDTNELFELFEFLEEKSKQNTILLQGNHENYFHLLKEYEKLKVDMLMTETLKSQEEKIKLLEEEILAEPENEAKIRKLKKLKSKHETLKRKVEKIEEMYQQVIRKNIPTKTRQTLHELTTKFGHKRVRNFFRKLMPMTKFKFGTNEYFITHGGFPNIPTIFDKTIEFIRGVGDYGEEEEVIKTFAENTYDNQYIIFGHRDIFEIKNSMLEEYRGCVLNGDAEMNPNGSIKCLVIKKTDVGVEHKFIEEKTTRKVDDIPTFYKNKIETMLEEDLKILEEKGIIFTAKRHKFVDVKVVKKEEKYTIFAVNFSNKAFKKGIWDSMSIHSRGLFILQDNETLKETIIARGYHKFFNLNEREETRIENLKNLKYPLLAFEKANGYLGLLSAYKNPKTNEIEFFISSKTSIDGEYAKVFKEMIEPYLNPKIKEFLYKNNVTALFEVIEPEFDPHIQEYKEPELVFLNLIKNQIDFELLLEKEDEFVNLFNSNEMIRKVNLLKKIETYKELIEYLDELNSKDLFENNFIEGVVLREEGISPFMFKLKTNWYKFWKGNRTLTENVFKRIQNPILQGEDKEIAIKKEIGIFKNRGGYEYQKYLNFLIEKIENDENINKNIIELRNEFLNSLS
jgi:predicted kinase